MKYLLILLFVFPFIVNGQEQDSNSDKINKIYRKAGEFLEREKFDSSLLLYENVALIYKKEELWLEYFNSKVRTIRCLRSLRKNQNAISLAEKILNESIEKLGENNPAEGYIYYMQGNLLGLDKSDFNTGKDFFNKAINIQEKLNGNENRVDLAETYHSIAILYWQNGEYNLSLEYNNRALSIRKEILGDEHSAVCKSYQNIGIVYSNLGNYDKASEYYHKTLNINKKIFPLIHPTLALNYFNLGNLYLRKGEYNFALEYQQKALDIWLQLFGENHFYVSYPYSTMGIIFREKGDFELAFENHKKSLEIRLKTLGNEHPLVARSYNGLGSIEADRKNYQSAINYYNKGLNIQKKSLGPNHPDIASMLNDIGTVYAENNNYKKAIEYFQKSLDIYTKTLGKNHFYVTVSYNNLGSAFNNIKNFDKALEYLQNGICSNVVGFSEYSNFYKNPSINDIYDPIFLLESLGFKAQVLSSRNISKDRKYSIETLMLCDSLINKMRNSYQNKSDKVSLGRLSDKVYKYAVVACFKFYEETEEKRYLEKAFYFAERNKSSVLLGAIADSQAKKFTGIPDSLLKLEKEIKFEISNFRQKLTDLIDSTKKIVYNEKLFVLKRKHDELIKTFEKNYPKYYQLKYDSKQPLIYEIQNHIKENSEFLEYFLSDSSIYVFKLSKKEFQVKKLPLIKNLNQQLLSMKKYLKEENIDAFSETSFSLYSQLIDPLNIKTQNILIIPDGPLWQLNFDLLLKSEPKVLEYKSLPYMIKDHNISYGYSAKLLKYKSFQSKEAPKNECLAFSYNNSENVSTGNYIAMRGEGDLNSELIDLPGTRKEIEAVSSVLSGAYYYGTFANERNFKTNAKDYNILHLALHGVIDNEDPMNSRLFFTQDKDSVEDNYLHAYELYNLELNAELAVLSACNTGSGKIVKGEGIMSLGRAFTYAGCKSLLLSQWDVSDAFTPGIMKDFYANLKEGKSKSASLREAKLAFLESADNLSANPYFWAPLVQLGDDRPLKQDKPWMIWALTIIAASVILGVVLMRKRK